MLCVPVFIFTSGNSLNNCFSIHCIPNQSIASDKKGILSGQNSAGKVISHASIVFCKPVDIPSLSSQSEYVKMDIHWFGIY